MPLSIFLLLAAVMVFSGCDDQTSPSAGFPEEGVGFSYSGADFGSFEAVGTPTIDTAGSLPLTEFAGAVEANNVISVVSFQPISDSTGDAFILTLGNPQHEGTLYINPVACSAGDTENCVMGMFIRNVGLGDLTQMPQAGEMFLFHSGSVELMQIDSVTLAGRFEGLANRSQDPTGVLTISDGHFNVTITRDLPILW